MRIQHNIMAMNAYRNYTTNTSAMQKNLERLSSGYKINRAGDDAAGLAISEKMRAQITGLEVAQKNAKDGISLVQTAEGALTEVHDMLNRMVELATQSANGTYSNDTDRVQLQKELDQLRDEINRIADSANFNGIQLLDGNMDAGGDTVYNAIKFAADKTATDDLGTGVLPAKGDELGVNTVVHAAGITSPSDANGFSIDLEELTLKGKGAAIDIKIGDNLTITVTNNGDDSVTADKIVEAIKAGGKGNITVSFGKDEDDNEITLSDDGELDINGATFKLTAEGTRLSFEQTDGDDIEIPQVVTISDAKEPMTIGELDDNEVDFTDGDNGTVTTANATLEFDLAGLTVDKAGWITISIGDHSYDIEITDEDIDATDGVAKAETIADKLMKAINAKKDISDDTAGVFTAAVDGTTKSKIILTSAAQDAVADDSLFTGLTISVEEKEMAGTFKPGTKEEIEAEVGGDAASTQVDMDPVSGPDMQDIDWSSSTGIQGMTALDGKTISVSIGDDTYVVTLKANGTATDDGYSEVELSDGGIVSTSPDDPAGLLEKIKNALMAQINAKNMEGAQGTDNYDKIENLEFVLDNDGKITGVTYDLTPMTYEENVNENFSGDYNFGTTVIKTAQDDTPDRLASTWFEVDSKMITEGSQITIGKDTYTFTTDKSKLGKDGYVVYNEGEEVEQILKNLTDAAANNKTYTVGYDGNRITLLEKSGQKNFDLTTVEGIEKSLGFKTATINPTDTSKGLTLQIGDTAESYNQLKVNIKDCHVKALGIDDISIANQADAAEAVDAINDAINYVSDVRGTLGATQNRLDHTINNLSVMTENIQDAESTIRDTDIAEEMMAYTKNNILIQAAQAMLAQANQVPQGVLQLLQ